MASIAYLILQTQIIRLDGCDSKLAQVIGSDPKGKLSAISYAIAIGLSFFKPWIAVCIYIGVALMWLVPDRRMERVLNLSGS